MPWGLVLSAPNLVARKISWRFPVRLNLRYADVHIKPLGMNMNVPFSYECFTIAINVGRVPEVATILKCSVKDLRYDKIKFSPPIRGQGNYLEPLLVLWDRSIIRRYSHGTKAYGRHIINAYLTCWIRHQSLKVVQ